MDQNEQCMRHLADLCRRAERTGQWFYSAFLSPAEQEDFRMLPSSAPYSFCFWGGIEQAERKILAAGSREDSEPVFPLAVLKITPLSLKFAEDLTHRDYLGALMNLGIDRSLIGDILPDGKQAWVICLSSAKDWILDGLHRVRRTEVSVQEAEPDCEELRPRYAPLSLNVPSERLDAIVSGFTGLSREKASGLFPAEKVFVNGRPVLQKDAKLKAGDILSVRGYGKAVYDGVERESRKGRLVLALRKYV